MKTVKLRAWKSVDGRKIEYSFNLPVLNGKVVVNFADGYDNDGLACGMVLSKVGEISIPLDRGLNVMDKNIILQEPKTQYMVSYLELLEELRLKGVRFDVTFSDLAPRSEESLKEVCFLAENVIIYDHHPISKHFKGLNAPNLIVYHSDKKCGSKILFEQKIKGSNEFIELIDKRDRFDYKDIPHKKYIDTCKTGIEELHKLNPKLNLLDISAETFYQLGKGKYGEYFKEIRLGIDRAETIAIRLGKEKYRVMFVQDIKGLYISDTAYFGLRGKFKGCNFFLSDNFSKEQKKHFYGLRGVGSVNVGEIAKNFFNGGGHKDASGGSSEEDLIANYREK